MNHKTQNRLAILAAVVLAAVLKIACYLLK
jgi:hypothetical protein